MTRPGFPTYLDRLRAESALFRSALAACDPTARVPACPDWDAGDLVWHLGEVQLFWGRIIRTRPASPDETGFGPPERPDSYPGLLEFFDESSATLVAELSEADPAEVAWSWSAEHTVGFTYRRQAHEALIHRVDAEQTAGLALTALDPELAADGVAELVEVMYGGAPPSWASFEPGPASVRLDLTDVHRQIWVRPGELTGTHPETGRSYDGPHLVVETAGGEPGAVVSGTAGDLDSWFWHRSDVAPTVSGDPDAYGAFVAAVSEPLT